jgi:gas vesicle protein
MPTHGSLGGIVGGVVVGGVAGLLLTPEKNKSYSGTRRRTRKQVEPRRDRDSDYDSGGNYIYRR